MRTLGAAATLSLLAAALLIWSVSSEQQGLDVSPVVALLGAAAFAAAGTRMIQMLWWPHSNGAGMAAMIALILGLVGLWMRSDLENERVRADRRGALQRSIERSVGCRSVSPLS